MMPSVSKLETIVSCVDCTDGKEQAMFGFPCLFLLVMESVLFVVELFCFYKCSLALYRAFSFLFIDLPIN